MNKKYVFFYHYNKKNKKMSVHFRGVCYVVKNVICKADCQTKWSEKQPNIVMKGKCSSIDFLNDVCIINR